MQVVIITGATATGKTTLARYIAKKLGYQTLIKDDLKEALVRKDKHNPNLRNWRYFEDKSLKLLYEEIRKAIKNNSNVIIESNFNKAQQNKLAKLLITVPTKEIYCISSGIIILKRYVARKEKGLRSPVHQDKIWYPLVIFFSVLPHIWQLWNPPMRITEKIIKVNTNNPRSIDHQKIFNFIED